MAVYRGTGTQLREQIDSEIAGDADELAHTLASSGARTPRSALRGAPARYMRGQPFNASSTLLFALVPGGGHRHQQARAVRQADTRRRRDAGRSRRRRTALAAGCSSARAGYSTLSLPDVGDLRLLKRTGASPAGEPGGVTIGVGEPLASGRARAAGRRAGVHPRGRRSRSPARCSPRYLIGTRFSRAAAPHGRGGRAGRRRATCTRASTTPSARASEVRVLADAFNHMLDRLDDAFAGQRAFVADASHELRTPLTVIRGQLEVLAAQQRPSGEEVRRVERLVQAEIARITRLVDDLLLLAQGRADRSSCGSSRSTCATFVAELWDGVDACSAERRLRAGGGPRGHAAAPTPTGSPRRCATWSRNAIEHTAPERGLVRLRRRAAGERAACASSVTTTGPASPPSSASGSSTASTAPTPRATAPPAAPASGSRSCARSPRPTADGWRPQRASSEARAWSSSCPVSRLGGRVGGSPSHPRPRRAARLYRAPRDPRGKAAPARLIAPAARAARRRVPPGARPRLAPPHPNP